jgi:hypothetical protein
VAILDGHLLHAAILDVGNELRVVDLLVRGTPLTEVIEHGHQHKGDDDPEN